MLHAPTSQKAAQDVVITDVSVRDGNASMKVPTQEANDLSFDSFESALIGAMFVLAYLFAALSVGLFICLSIIDLIRSGPSFPAISLLVFCVLVVFGVFIAMRNQRAREFLISPLIQRRRFV